MRFCWPGKDFLGAEWSAASAAAAMALLEEAMLDASMGEGEGELPSVQIMVLTPPWSLRMTEGAARLWWGSGDGRCCG